MVVDYKKLKKGDSFMLGRRQGILLIDPEYLTTRLSGLFYADVEWDNGLIQRKFMICRTNIVWDFINQGK